MLIFYACIGSVMAKVLTIYIFCMLCESVLALADVLRHIELYAISLFVVAWISPMRVVAGVPPQN